MAAQLAAGLSGIEAGMELPDPARGDVYKGRTAMLPTSLRDARVAMLKSKMLGEAFGETVVRHYARAANGKSKSSTVLSRTMKWHAVSSAPDPA